MHKELVKTFSSVHRELGNGFRVHVALVIFSSLPGSAEHFDLS